MSGLSASLQLHDVQDTGEILEIKPKGDIRDELAGDRVLIIVNHEDRKIWVWMGGQARVRRKFIGARQAQAIRSQVGLTYKVISVEAGDESGEFLTAVGLKAPTKVEKPEVVTEVDIPTRPASKPKPVTTPKPKPKTTPKPKPKTTPTPTRPVATTPAPSSQLGQEYEGLEKVFPLKETGLTSPTKLDRIISIIESTTLPPGYARELVIIGHEVFTTVERTVDQMGKTKTTIQLERSHTLPEGTFFGGDYTPRIIVEAGRVLATEFLKRVNNGDRTSLRDTTQDAGVSQLLDIFQISTEKPKPPKRKRKAKAKP